MLNGKKIVLAISGGIAAYKCAELTRLLIKQNAQVRVVMTQAATEFITPLTMQALSKNPVSTDLLDPQAELAMGHIELAKWADLILVAPATANRIAHFAHGFANDLVATLCLATSAPIAIAPAMNQEMYHHMATQANLSLLKQRGLIVLGPASGEQACGDHGLGRMLEPALICDEVIHLLIAKKQILTGQKWLINAGPTREALDPVRYLTNQSSGKMGFAIAQAAAEAGAEVTLIAGPVHLETPNNGKIHRIDVISAQQMHEAVLAQASTHHCFIACAAVADYRPVTYHDQKIKKTEINNLLSIQLVRNPDIVADVAALSKNRPFVVGFAAETENLAQYAQNKLINKKLDLICANDVSQSDRGFNSDFNQLVLYWYNKHEKSPQGQIKQLQLTESSCKSGTALTKELTDKKDIARALVLEIDRLRTIANNIR